MAKQPTNSLKQLPVRPDIATVMHERLVFIDFRCFFLAELKRNDLMARFGIGTAAATRDIAFYRKELGGKIELDPITKTYQPASNFSPVFEHNVGRALTALTRGFGESQLNKSRALLTCETPPELCNPDVRVLAAVTRAIHRKRPIKIRYSSFSSGVSIREIVPFALANNGMRWHVRAFDRQRKQFIDFVLTRIHEAQEGRFGVIEDHEFPENDFEWGRVLELELVAHPKEKYPEIVAMDYKMTNGVLKIRVRAALASYLLRQWIVDCSTDHSLSGTEYRLWLRNAPILYGVANAHLAPGYKTGA